MFKLIREMILTLYFNGYTKYIYLYNLIINMVLDILLF